MSERWRDNTPADHWVFDQMGRARRVGAVPSEQFDQDTGFAPWPPPKHIELEEKVDELLEIARRRERAELMAEFRELTAAHDRRSR